MDTKTRDSMIVRFYHEGMSISQLGARFAVSEYEIRAIASRAPRTRRANQFHGNVERDAKIRKLHGEGMSISQLAARFAVSYHAIRNVILGKNADRKAESRKPESKRGDSVQAGSVG